MRFAPPCRTPNHFTKEEIKGQVPEDIRSLATPPFKGAGCYFYDLGRLHDYFYAIVIGWTPDDNEYSPEDDYHLGERRLTMRIGRCPINSISWCDLNFDWLLPTRDDGGNVWDTDMWLYPDSDTDKIIDYLFEEWEEMKKFYTEHNI